MSAKPQKRARPAQLVLLLGQRLGLLVGDHLQAVLDRAQEAIGRIELGACPGGDPASLLQALQGDERLGNAQLRLATAGNQLLGLHEEFDLANAATADLDVVPGDADGTEAAEGMDLPLHGVDVGDGREIQVLAPDIGREVLQDGAACGDVAGDGPRLDEGGALPVLADALVVDERRAGRDGKRGGTGVGPEPQVGAEHVAIAGALGQQAHEIAGDAHEERLGLEAGAQADAREVVEDDEVDVGGVVELEGAVFAHAEHDVAGRVLGQPVAGPGGLAEEEADRRRYCRVGGFRRGGGLRSSPARRRPDRKVR